MTDAEFNDKLAEFAKTVSGLLRNHDIAYLWKNNVCALSIAKLFHDNGLSTNNRDKCLRKYTPEYHWRGGIEEGLPHYCTKLLLVYDYVLEKIKYSIWFYDAAHTFKALVQAEKLQTFGASSCVPYFLNDFFKNYTNPAKRNNASIVAQIQDALDEVKTHLRAKGLLKDEEQQAGEQKKDTVTNAGQQNNKGEDEFTKEQREWFRITQKFEQFNGQSLVPGSPEYEKRMAIESELCEFIEKHCTPEPIDTPDKLSKWIDDELVTLDMIKMDNRGEFPSERAKESYRKSRDYARAIRESNPSLPALPPRLNAPEDGLQSMQEWCTDAKLAKLQTAETESKESPLLPPFCRDIKNHIAHIETPIEFLGFLEDGYERIYDKSNLDKEPSFFHIISECAVRIRKKYLSLNLREVPINGGIAAYKDWCISALQILDKSNRSKTNLASTKQNSNSDATPKTDSSLIYQANASDFYNIPKSVLSKAAQKQPGEPGYLWSGHDGKRVFYKKADVEKINRSRTKLKS